MIKTKKSLIVVTWDGITQPLKYIYHNAKPNYDLLVFDYSGKAQEAHLSELNPVYFLSNPTECKGQIITALYNFILSNELADKYEFIGIFDDDQFISVSDINKLLFIGNVEGLDVFQPSLTHDSFYDNRQFINKPGYNILPTDWVEVMCPFYRMEVFTTMAPYCIHNISGTGLDVYLVPTVQYLLGMNSTAVVHAVQLKHCRPVRTGARLFSNNKSSIQEIQEMKALSLQLLNEKGSKDPNDPIYQNLLRIVNQTRNGEIGFLEKIKRIPLLIKNIYRSLVDASYR